jgi:ADP-ribosylglycohydrolase
VLWSAAGQLNDFEEALWQTAGARGDVDTKCAMVGGIVAGFTGFKGIPERRLRKREQLPLNQK